MTKSRLATQGVKLGPLLTREGRTCQGFNPPSLLNGQTNESRLQNCDKSDKLHDVFYVISNN